MIESNWCVHTTRRRTDVCTKLYNVMWADVSRDYIATMYSDAEEAVALAVVVCLQEKGKKQTNKSPDMPHDTDYTYPIRILAFFLK